MALLRIGVLALQGGFAPHLARIAELGHEGVEVRAASDLEPIDGLILPGGESTAQLKLIDRFGLGEPLDRFATSGKPVLATCAGLILAAKEVIDPEQRSFGWLDVKVARNAFGRQLDSFEALDDDRTQRLVFIRAPRIRSVGAGAEVRMTFQGEPILVRSGSIYGLTFHPELTSDPRIHREVFGTGR